jgi:hypothetical protein
MAGARGLDATSYVALSACESFWRADTVFVGTTRKHAEQEIRTFADRVIAREREERLRTRLHRTVIIDVSERLRGHLQNSIEVENHTAVDWGEGESLLVYATRNPDTGRLEARIASRTQPFTTAAQEVGQLRRFAKIKKTERLIVGNVPTEDHGEGVGTDLILSCGARMYKTRSNADGTFEFRIGKPSGPCDLRPIASNARLVSSSSVVFIEPRTCANVQLLVTLEKP